MIRYRSGLAFGLKMSSADPPEGFQRVAVEVKAMKQLRVYGQGALCGGSFTPPHCGGLFSLVLWGLDD